MIQILDFTAVLAGSDELGQLERAELQLKCGALIEIDAFAGVKDRLIYDIEESSRNGLDYYILPAVEEISEYGGAITGYYKLFGLIVERAERRSKGYFARVGLCDLSFKGNKSRDLVTKLLSADSSISMDESLYHQVLEPNSDGLKQYSIILV